MIVPGFNSTDVIAKPLSDFTIALSQRGVPAHAMSTCFYVTVPLYTLCATTFLCSKSHLLAESEFYAFERL